MSGGILRFPWTRQPQQPVGIDRSNPVNAGIVFATETSFGGVNVAGTERQEPLGAGVTFAAGQYGRQWNFSGSQANRANSFGIFQGLTGATEATWDITVYFSGANPTTHFFGQWDFNLAWLMQASAGTLIWVAADDAAGLRDRFDLSGAFPAAGWYRITGSWKQSGHVGLLVINGAQKSPTTAGNTATSIQTPNTADYLQLGMVSGGSALNGAISGARIWRRALSLPELLSVNRNSNQVYAPIQRTIWVPAAGGGGVSGTLATTNANDTSAATGTTTVTGTLAKTNANDSSSASGTTTVTGTLATTNANDTSAASGSPVVVGTLATTNANDSVVASGDVGGNITGTVNYTNANDTGAASGTTTVTGSLATTNANDSASASGTTTVTGSLARTNANDSVVASGAAGTVTGTVNVTNDNDTSSASGTAGNPFIASQGGGGWLPQTRRKSRKQIYEERVKLGILPPPVIKAAAKVAAVAQTVEEFKEERPKYEEMFLKAIKKTEWLPDYTRAIQAQLAIIELEEEELLLLL